MHPASIAVAVCLLSTAAAPARVAAQTAPSTPPPQDAPATPAAQPPASTPPAPPAQPDTEARLDALAEELRRLKLELAVPDVEYRSHAGMGPAASKVYFTPKGLSLGGYGEAVYAHNLQPERLDESDLLRLILYTGYRFSDRVVFNAEIEFEHAHSLKRGEVAVEFAYLDFLLTDYARIRVGNLLVPIGFINEMHEPAFFHGVLRPDLERTLIPSTWNENGAGLYGDLGGGLRYKAYLLNGLQAIGNRKCVVDTRSTADKADDVKLCDTGNEGFTRSSWIRNGRQRGSKALTESFAGVFNLELQREIFTLGATAYAGRSGQNQHLDDRKIRGNVLLTEAHASLTWRGLQARAIFAIGGLGDAERISQKQGQAVARRTQGGYAELAYDVFTLLLPGEEQSLSPFVRYEGMNLHHGVPEGFERDPSLATRTLTAGLTYKPLTQVAVKADYQRRTSAKEGAAVASQLNLGVGFVF